VGAGCLGAMHVFDAGGAVAEGRRRRVCCTGCWARVASRHQLGIEGTAKLMMLRLLCAENVHVHTQANTHTHTHIHKCFNRRIAFSSTLL
jgi:hypothetical protein